MSTTRLGLQKLTRLLQLAATLLISLYLLLIGGGFASTVVYPLQLLNATAAGALGLLWLALRLAGRARLAATGLELPLLALVAAQGIAALTSAQPRLSLERFVLMTAWAAGFLIVCDLIHRGWPREYLRNALFILAAVIGAQALAEVLAWYRPWLALGEWPPVTYRARGLMVHPNTLGVVTVMLLPLPIVAAWRTRSWPARAALGLVALSLLATLFFTSSRGAWIAAGGMFAVLFGLLTLAGIGFSPRAQLKRWLRAPLWLRAVSLAGATITAVLGGWLLSVQASHITHGALVSGRTVFWRPAWQLFVEDPLTGLGPGLYGWAYGRFASLPPAFFAVHAHSLPMQVLSTNGLMGVLALAALVLAGAAQLWRRWQTSSDRPALAALIAGLTGFGIHSLFDYLLLPVVAFFVLALAALALAREPAAAPDAAAHRVWPAWALAPAILLPVAFSIFSLRASATHIDALVAAQEERWVEAAQLFEQAASMDPGLSLYQAQAAYAYTRAGDLAHALPLWEHARQTDPYWAANHANVAVLTGDRAAMQAAVDLSPASYLLAVNAGALAEAQGLADAASAEYQRALNLNPDKADALFWQQTAPRRAALDAWRAGRPTDESALAQGWQALANGQPEQATALFEQAAAADPALLAAHLGTARARLVLGDLAQAELALHMAKRLPTIDVEHTFPIVLLEGDLLAARGQREAAAAQYALLFYAINDYTLLGPGTYAGTVRTWQAYARAALPSDLVPQIVRADITAEMERAFAQLAAWRIEAGDAEAGCAILARVAQEAPESESGRVYEAECR